MRKYLLQLSCFTTGPLRKPHLYGLQSTTLPTASPSKKHGNAHSSSSLGLIAGVSASIATIVLVIAVVVLYRRRKSR